MADKKISQLTAASLPLAGTEVLPIVQSSATVKVATDDLTVKNVRSNATTGILQIAGPGAGTTRTMTTPNANFTAARTDAAQSFTGDQTLGTGNIVQGTAAKGINFTANTPAAGMTSQLLNWYEEGTWTPNLTNNGTITFTAQYGRYTRIGRQVHLYWFIQVDTVSGGNGVAVMTAPFAAAVPANGIFSYVGTNGVNTTGQPACNSPAFYASNKSIYFYDISGGVMYGVNVTAGSVIAGSMTYFV